MLSLVHNFLKDLEKCELCEHRCGANRIKGKVADIENSLTGIYLSDEARLAGSYAHYAGCQTHIRNCEACSFNQECRLKKYIPRVSS